MISKIGMNGYKETFWRLRVPDEECSPGLEVGIVTGERGITIGGSLITWADVDEARAQLPSQGGEAVEVVGVAILGGLFHGGSGPELGDIDVELNTDVLERIQAAAVTTSDDVMVELMTVAQHQRIMAASVGSAEPVGVVLTEEQMGIGYDRRIGPVLWFGAPPPGAKIYTHPADPGAVPVRRELLERLAHADQKLRYSTMEEARHWLDQYRQIARALMANSEGVKK